MNGRRLEPTICITVLLIFLLSVVANENATRTEYNCSSTVQLWRLLLHRLTDLTIKLTENEYEFTPLVWPHGSIHVKHNVTIGPIDPFSPPLLSFALLFKLVVIHPGSNLQLSNLIIKYSRSKAFPTSILGFFKILPGASASIVNCTLLLQECDNYHLNFTSALLEANTIETSTPFNMQNMTIEIESALLSNLPGEGQWIVENLTYACEGDFNFQSLKPPPSHNKTVAPLSGRELVIKLLDKSTRYFDIHTGISLQDSDWPASGLLLSRNITLRGPTGAQGPDRPHLFVGEKAPLWEVRMSSLELKNLIFEFQSPLPDLAGNNQYILDEWAHYGLENSNVTFAGLILPAAFVTSHHGVYVLSNTRLRYNECPPWTISRAVDAFNASGESEGFTWDTLDDSREILYVAHRTLVKYGRGDPMPFEYGRTELTDVEFECVSNTPVAVVEQEIVEFEPVEEPKAAQSSDQSTMSLNVAVELGCVLVVVFMIKSTI